MIKGVIFSFALALGAPSFAGIEGPLVTVSDISTSQGTSNAKLFRVILNDNTAAHAKAVGVEYGRAVLRVMPNYASVVDTYLTSLFVEILSVGGFTGIGCDQSTGNLQGLNSCLAPKLFARIAQMRGQMDSRFQDQIDGMASVVADATSTSMGTGTLSPDEFWLFNLWPDVIWPSACSTLAVWGGTTGNRTLVGRNLDWTPGTSSNGLGNLNAITKFKGNGIDLYTIGWLGFFGAATGYNSQGVFGALLAGPSLEDSPYSAVGKYSFAFDLRGQLETATNAASVATAMTNPSRLYAYSHLVSLADRRGALVVENNMVVPSGRTIRTPSTPLNKNVDNVKAVGPITEDWNFTDTRKDTTSMAAVNDYMTAGNNNPTWDSWYTDSNGGNAGRWATFQKSVQAMTFGQVQLADVQRVMSAHTGDTNIVDGMNNVLVSNRYSVTQQSITLNLTDMTGGIWLYPAASPMLPLPTVTYSSFDLLF